MDRNRADVIVGLARDTSVNALRPRDYYLAGDVEGAAAVNYYHRHHQGHLAIVTSFSSAAGRPSTRRSTPRSIADARRLPTPPSPRLTKSPLL